MQRLFAALSAGILLVAAGTALAQNTKTAAPTPNREIRKLLSQIEDGFSRGDAEGLAACWTPGGDFTGPAGQRVEGRENIEKAFREFFSAHGGGKLKLLVSSVRVVNDDLALVEAVPQMQPPATEGADESGLSLVLAKRDHRWLIESARETLRRGAAQGQALKDLAWLVGEWADEASPPHAASVHSTCDWTANHAFLIRRFKVETASGISRAGTEIIGWDPHTRRIRSWVFDANGGFGENTWVRDGNRWLISYRGTRPDGSEVSATTVLTRADANTLTLESKDITADAQRQPDVPPITIKRQPAVPDAAKNNDSKQPPRQILP